MDGGQTDGGQTDGGQPSILDAHMRTTCSGLA